MGRRGAREGEKAGGEGGEGGGTKVYRHCTYYHICLFPVLVSSVSIHLSTLVLLTYLHH